MTPEQAVAWLILEEWVVAHDGGEARWWVRLGEVSSTAVKIVTIGSEAVSTAYLWNVREFEYTECPSAYLDLAAEVVEVIIKEGL